MDPIPSPNGRSYSAADDASPLLRWLQVHPILAGVGFGLIALIGIVTRWGWASGMVIVGPLIYGVFNWWAWRPNGWFWRARRNIWVDAHAQGPGGSGTA